MSIIDPLTCGFGKVTVFTLFANPTNLKKQDKKIPCKFKSREYKYRFEKFNDAFAGCENFQLQYQHFTTNFTKIKEHIQLLGKNDSSMKSQILDVFSTEKWHNLSKEEKDMHSLYNCQACSIKEQYRYFLSKFPTQNRSGKRKAAAAGLDNAKNIVLLDTTKKIVNDLNKAYTKVFGKTFTEAQQIIMERPSIDKENISAREIEIQAMKKMSKNIQDQWAETSVER